MKTLLLIGSNPRVGEAVRDMAELCGVRLVHAKTCACAWQFMEHSVTFDAVVIELWPWLSRLVLLAELNKRSADLPILAVTDSSDNRMLAEAYGARAAMPTAHLNATGLAQRFGWSTHSVPPARCIQPANGENVMRGRKSLSASPRPASRPSRAVRIGSREPFRASAFTKTKRRTPTRSLAAQDNKLTTQHR